MEEIIVYKIILGNEIIEIIKVREGYTIEEYVKDNYSQFNIDVKWEKLIY